LILVLFGGRSWK